MTWSKQFFVIMDNGGRRSEPDRRRFSYSVHILERRSGQDRRSGQERRTGIDRRKVIEAGILAERRSDIDRRAIYRSRK
jgi:hypothetical protein